jgi:hypothetical protein
MAPSPSFAGPLELVTALQNGPDGQDAARAELRRLFEPVIRHLSAQVEDSPSRREQDHRLHSTLLWQEMRLRSAPPDRLTGQDWRTFGVRESAAIACFLLETFGQAAEAPDSFPPAVRLQTRPVPPFRVESSFLPWLRVGGDWHTAEPGAGGRLWVLVADVTGKGPRAHLVARALPHLWGLPELVRARAEGVEPRRLLRLLHNEIRPVLPLGVFVEAVLGVFVAQGSALVAAAGACLVLRRPCGQEQAVREELGGPWLGLPVEDVVHDQRTWPFAAGDELTLASDGLADQPAAEGRLRSRLPEAPRQHPGGLHVALLGLVEEALGGQPQHDDITFVTVRREAPSH